MIPEVDGIQWLPEIELLAVLKMDDVGLLRE